MRPLEHITILDLSRVLACPFASMILAELGARVIKVEQPGSGDETRGFEPFIEPAAPGAARQSAYYFAANRSKQSIAVNLRSPEGQALIRELALQADVFLENFPVGTLARYGLDAAALRAQHPELVYVSCTGFGQSGPYAERKGYDTVFQAMGGLLGLTGERGGGPVKPGLPVADLSSGLWVAVAILAALTGRAASGRGTHVDFAMLDGQIALLSTAAARWFALGEVPERLGTEHPGRVPSASFACRGGEWLHITASDAHWPPLCRVLGLQEWGARPELADNSGRVRQRAEVMERLAAAVASWRREELWDALARAGVPAGPIRALDEILADPHTHARGMLAHFEHPGVGRFPCLPVPLRFSDWDAPRVERPPLLGEHTEAVLAERLGYDPERIAALREAKAI
jgi:crotonobetainyl-CoA:carnitine CoA-transferase CaiB-like acyl-CoA transferase